MLTAKSIHNSSVESSLVAARRLLSEADKVLVGAGAGLSTAAGLSYNGHRFHHEFRDFIRRYGFSDLYSAGFYPFDTMEEYWACWALHIDFVSYRTPALPLYRDLLGALRGKEWHVVTTNVDGQFRKAGFDAQHIFEVQGDYAFLQCARRCHDTLYHNERLVKQMVAATHHCRIPSELVPRCPQCGGPMAVHVRVDQHFVEDEAWHAAAQRYARFLDTLDTGRVVLLELGVGFNTPGIIRFPFERFALKHPNATLIRVNRDNTASLASLRNAILLPTEIAQLRLGEITKQAV